MSNLPNPPIVSSSEVEKCWLFTQNPDGTLSPAALSGGGSASAFNLLTSGTNSSASMVVGSGASLSASGTGQILATNVPAAIGTINPIAFGAKFDMKVFVGTQLTFSSGSKTVACTGCNFTAADVGKVVWGTNGCCNGGPNGSSLLVLPAGTIQSITDSSHIVVSVAATANISGSNNAWLGYGTDDTAAHTAASTAWHNSVTCTSVQLPAGFSITTAAQYNQPPTACQFLDLPSTVSGKIFGQGSNTSMLYLPPNFNWASCTFGIGNNACFLGFPSVTASDWGISGGWNNGIGGGHSNILVNPGVTSRLTNMQFEGFAAGDGTTIGLATGDTSFIVGVNVLGFGNSSCQSGANNFMFWNAAACGNSNGASFSMSGNGTLYTHNLALGQVLSGATVGIFGAGTWFSDGDFWFSTTTSSNMNPQAAATIHFNHLQATGAAAAGLTTANGLTIHLRNSVIGGTIAVNRNGTPAFYDEGGNTYLGGTLTTITPTCTFTSGGGSTPSCTLQAGSTNEKGVIIASTGTGSPGSTGTITLTFAGTFTGATGAAPICQFFIDNSGTAWGGEAVIQTNTQSTTAPVIAWANINAVALANLSASSPYRIGYQCTPR